MEIRVETKPKSQVLLTLVITDEELRAYEASTMKKLIAETKLPGFRPGKAPEARIREHFGNDAIQARVIDQALPKFYLEAIRQKGVQAVGRPLADITALKPLTVTFTVDVYPTVKVKKVDGIKLKRQEVAVSDADVQEVLADLQKRGRSFLPVDRAAQVGDSVEVSFTGEVEGRADGRLKSQHHPLTIGSQSFVPGFEEQLVGMKRGDVKDVSVTFPADYRHVDFRGKPVTFHVTVDAVEEVKLPPQDDALARSVTGKDDATLEKLKGEIRTDLQRLKDEEEHDRLDRAYADALVERVEVDVPESLTHDEVHYMIDELAGRVQGQGLKFEHYLELQRTTRDELEQKLRPEAEKRVKIRLALRALAEERKVVVPAEEVDAALAAVDDPKLRSDARFRTQLESQLLLSRTLSSLRDAATRS